VVDLKEEEIFKVWLKLARLSNAPEKEKHAKPSRAILPYRAVRGTFTPTALLLIIRANPLS
jgi:hypothetical protein